MQGVDRGADRQAGEADFEQRLDRALASVMAPKISADFAKRVAARVPMRPVMPASRRKYAQWSVAVGALVLVAAMLLVAPHATIDAPFAIGLEWMLCVQLSLLALYVALPGTSWRSGR